MKKHATKMAKALLKRQGYIALPQSDWDFLNHEKDRWRDRRYLQRSRHWVRKGYVEEVYCIPGDNNMQKIKLVERSFV